MKGNGSSSFGAQVFLGSCVNTSQYKFKVPYIHSGRMNSIRIHSYRYIQCLLESGNPCQELNICMSVLLASQNPGFSVSHKNHGRPVFLSTSPPSWISARLNIFLLWKHLEVLGYITLLHKCKILSLKRKTNKPALPIFRWCVKKKPNKPPYCHMQDRKSMLFIKTSTNGRLFSNTMGSRGERPAKNPMETHDWLQNCNTDLISFK